MRDPSIRRVGLLVNAWPEVDAIPAGTGRNALYVATELTRRGIEVSVLATVSTGENWHEARRLNESGARVEIVDLLRPTYRASYRSVSGEAVLRDWLTRHEFDAVHVIHPGETGVLGPAIIAAAGLPVVITACDAYFGCHMGHLVNPRDRRPLCDLPVSVPECARCMAVGTGTDAEWMLPLSAERRLHAEVAIRTGPVLADSGFIARQLRQAFGDDVSPRVVALPAEAPTITADNRTGPVVFGFFGEPLWRKGLDLLLDAARGLDVPIEIHAPIGSRVDNEYAERMHEQAGQIGNVRWIGPYQPADTYNRIRSVDVVTVPSRAESLPGVIKEALAAGRPVLAADVAGIPELVGPHNGWLVAPDNAAALRDAIVRLSTDPDRTRAVRPSFVRTRAAYVDDLLDEYHAAQQSFDWSRARRGLERATASTEADAFTRRDERYQRGLVRLANGSRAGLIDVVRSVHPSASDRIWDATAWTLAGLAPYDRVAERLLRVHQAPLGSDGRFRGLADLVRLLVVGRGRVGARRAGG